MANRSLLTLDLRNIPLMCLLGIGSTMLFSGCGSTPNLSALENDELYLSKGEEFVTDAQYLAFALQEAGYDAGADGDYYDPNRAQANDFSPRYQPSFRNNQNAMQWGLGLASGQSPFGWGMSNNYDPFMNSGFGYNPYGGGMGFGNSGLGYNPYGGFGGYNPYGGFGGYNPYGGFGGYNGFSPYGGGYNPYSYTNWSGGNSESGGSTITGFTRTPIMSTTAGGSNYDGNSLVRPRERILIDDESVLPSGTTGASVASPNVINSETTSGKSSWFPSTSPTPNPTPTHRVNGRKNRKSLNRSEPNNGSGRDALRENRTNSNRTNQPVISTPRGNSNSSTRSNSNSGSNRPAGSTRSKRGGGQ